MTALRTAVRAALFIVIALLTLFTIGAIEYALPGWQPLAIATATLLTLLAIALHRKGHTR